PTQHPPPTPRDTLSLHDALPISLVKPARAMREGEGWTSSTVKEAPIDGCHAVEHAVARRHGRKRDVEPLGMARCNQPMREHQGRDRKSTRLNSSHQIISYAVFCL